jgi:hypothetical protein
MNHIGDLFSKIKSSFVNISNKKDVVVAVCKEKAGIELKNEQIEIQGKVIRLNISSGAKSVVFIKKQGILEELNKNFKPAIVDIK